MEKEHRRIILDNMCELIRLTNYETLMKKCLEQKIMFPIMQSEIEKLHIGPETKHKMLFEKITHRGPNAFQGLYNICRSHFEEAANLLQRKSTRFGPEVVVTYNSDDEFMSIRGQRKKDEAKKKNREKHNESSLPFANRHVNRQPLSVDRTDRCENIKLEPFTKAVDPPKQDIQVKKSKRFNTHKTLDTYDMRSRHRGVFFLVNIINFQGKGPRNGASVDRDNLVTLFRGMEFDIFYNEDITSLEFYKLVDQLIASKQLKETDSLVFAVLTHGNWISGNQYIEFTDGTSTTVQKILDKFNNINCKSMLGKPKIFLFPMCRGFVSDKGTSIIAKKTEKDGISKSMPDMKTIGTSSDIKICYATIPGFETHRDPYMGSWYIQALCSVFAEHAHEHHLDDMLKMIGEETSRLRTDKGELQTASTEENGFHKHLYFNPGYYED